MKTFAEYLPTMTAREREIVEVFHEAYQSWYDEYGCLIAELQPPGPVEIMRSAPPAKEPVSVEGVIRDTKDGSFVRLPSGHPWIGGNCVRVVKIEEPT